MSTTVEEAVRIRPRTRRFNVRQLRDFSLIPVILLLLLRPAGLFSGVGRTTVERV